MQHLAKGTRTRTCTHMHAHKYTRAHKHTQAGAKAGGAWIKGTVHRNTLLEQQHQAGGAGSALDADPWGSVYVVWDVKDGGTQGRVRGGKRGGQQSAWDI